MNDESSLQMAAEELLRAVGTINAALAGEGGSFGIATVLEVLSQYAWAGVTPTAPALDDLLHEASVAVELLRGSLISPAGDELMPCESKDVILRAVTAAQARRDLENGEDISIEALATLARVSERTIRAATSSKNPNAIPIRKDGHWTYIRAPHALEWLASRSDFVPTQVGASRPQVPALMSAVHVGRAWKSWREGQSIDLEDLARVMGWNEAQADAYRQIEAERPSEAYLLLTPEDWRRLAEHLGAEQAAELASQSYLRVVNEFATWRVRQAI